MTLQFAKEGRLKSKKSIVRLFKTGRSYSSPPIRFIYQVNKNLENQGIKVTFSVPKRTFRKAVDRNLLKRRMRESYRIYRNQLNDLAKERNVEIEGIFIYQASDILSFRKIKSSMAVMTNRISKVID